MILTEIGDTVGAVAGVAGRSVVGLGGHWGMGSGVVLDDELVLTSAHNVSRRTSDGDLPRRTGGAGTGSGDRCRRGPGIARRRYRCGGSHHVGVGGCRTGDRRAGHRVGQPRRPGAQSDSRLRRVCRPVVSRARADGDWQEASSTPPSPLPALRVGPWSIWTECWLGSTPAVWVGGSIWRRLRRKG